MTAITPEELTPLHVGSDGTRMAMSELGGMAAAYYHLPAGHDSRPLYRGLPNDMCPCRHWGYIVRGKLEMLTPTGSELLQAGQLFHLAPGHVGIVLEDTEMVEFTPIDEYRRKSEFIAARLDPPGER
jgi:hypothetical protein